MLQTSFIYNSEQVNQLPESFIARSKQRLKQYGDKVFLNDGENFEIEIYNPLQETISVRIKINGKDIGGSLVLKPGQRYFLDRFIQTPNKFKFTTYLIDETDGSATKAIELNGNVEVEFFKEKTIYYYTSKPSLNINYFSKNQIIRNVNDTSIVSSQNNIHTSGAQYLETGRIESGGPSEQRFQTFFGEFDVIPFRKINWKILPTSQKPIEPKDLEIRYCVSCGAKKKKTTHKFCPNCGTKFE